MIDRDHKLSITRQASLLNISRGTVYYLPQPVSPADLALMRRIDELHLEHPFMGARMLRDQLNRQGLAVGRRHVRTLMQRMGIDALAPQPGTSQAAPHVSAAAAMLMARYPELNRSPRRIKRILCESATDLGRERAFQGHGLLDILRALQSF